VNPLRLSLFVICAVASSFLASAKAEPLNSPPFALNRESFRNYLNSYYANSDSLYKVRFYEIGGTCRYSRSGNKFRCYALNSNNFEEMTYIEISDPRGRRICITPWVSWEGDYMGPTGVDEDGWGIGSGPKKGRGIEFLKDAGCRWY
jgi:hypothetical protein